LKDFTKDFWLIVAARSEDETEIRAGQSAGRTSKHIVNQKAGRFEPDKFEDQYETALVDLINQKRAGKPITPKERRRGENVVDLMDALRKSVGGAARKKPPRNPPRDRARRPPARRKCSCRSPAKNRRRRLRRRSRRPNRSESRPR
jgi:DNA end-binding protein Ku